MLNYGGGWTYGVDPYPTGDQLFGTGSVSNASNYSDPHADQLIATTVHGPGSLTAYEDYLAQQIPVLWMPQPVYQISEIASSCTACCRRARSRASPRRTGLPHRT